MRPESTRAEQHELTAGERAGAMLIVAAIVLPILCTVAILVTKHFLWVHYNTRSVTLWLVLNAAILVAGVLLRGEQHP